MTTPSEGQPLHIFVPINKVDAAKHLVYGTIAAEIADHSDEIMDYDSAKSEFDKWTGSFVKATDGKSAGNLRSMHSNIAAGKFNSVSFDDAAKSIQAVAHVVDDNEWKKVELGVYTGFSMGGSYGKRWKDPTNPELTRYTPRDIVEVSLVDNPCIPTATFDYIKADGAHELRKFQPVAEAAAVAQPAVVPTNAETTAPTNAEVFAKAQALAKERGIAAFADLIPEARNILVSERVNAHIREMPAAAAAATTVAEPAAAAAVVKVVAAVVEPDQASGDPLFVKQVWQANDGKAFPNKQEARDHNVKLAAEAVVAKAAAPALDALKGLAAALDGAPEAAKSTIAASSSATSGLTASGQEGVKKKDYSAEARKAMAAKGEAMKDGSFPIADKDDLKDAIGLVGNATNKTAAKRFVTRRARALKATDMLPADWAGSTKDATKAIEGGDLKKGSLYLVSSAIQMLNTMESLEEQYEQSGSYFGTYKPSPELATRFGSVLVETGDVIADMLDECLAEMKDEEAGEAMELAAEAGTLMKAGARHSQADKNRLQAIHDHSVGMGAACDNDAGKVAAADGGLVKMTAERDAFADQLTKIAPQITAIAARLSALEKSPATSPTPGLTIIDKSADNGGRQGAGVNEPLRASDGRLLTELSNDEFQLEIIKNAQRRPISVSNHGGTLNDRYNRA